jgi:hypothetical protein
VLDRLLKLQGVVPVKMVLTDATTPTEYLACFGGWQKSYASALHTAVTEAAPELEARLKWGHIVYFYNGPAPLVRIEPSRVLFGFWRGQRLRDIEPRLRPGGKYEMATLELKQGTALERAVVVTLAQEAARLNRLSGNPQAAAGLPGR